MFDYFFIYSNFTAMLKVFFFLGLSNKMLGICINGSVFIKIFSLFILFSSFVKLTYFRSILMLPLLLKKLMASQDFDDDRRGHTLIKFIFYLFFCLFTLLHHRIQRELSLKDAIGIIEKDTSNYSSQKENQSKWIACVIWHNLNCQHSSYKRKGIKACVMIKNRKKKKKI